MLKKLWGKFSKKEYPNRFLKFYRLNRKRLLKERRRTYYQKRKKGICVRCSKKALRGIVFCRYHKTKQREYNRIARS